MTRLVNSQSSEKPHVCSIGVQRLAYQPSKLRVAVRVCYTAPSLRVIIGCTTDNPHIRHKVRGLSEHKYNKRQRWSHDHLNSIIRRVAEKRSYVS